MNDDPNDNTNPNTLVSQGTAWAAITTTHSAPPEWYCPTRDTFQVRLETSLSHLEKQVGTDAYLLSAVVGEIGNNSFDHNLGNWPDISGVFFGTDSVHRVIVLADRGRGIRYTISRVMKDVKNDAEALIVAFTQIISGRSPERRGNGLKFVAKVVKDQSWSLTFISGLAQLTIAAAAELKVIKSAVHIPGCLAILYY